MPTRESTPAGAPCWVELFSSDTERANEFYSSVFGWSAERTGPEYGGYVNFTKDGHYVAGMMHNDGSHGAGDQWTVYLASDDAEETACAVKDNGGNLSAPPMEAPAKGFMAIADDPGGASVGIWQPTGFNGFGLVAEDGAPGWFELHTRTYEADVDFYRAAFGWDTHVAGDSPEFRYTTLGDGENQQAGIMDASTFPDDAPLGWSVYFTVADADATIAAIEAAGGAVVIPAEDTPYGRLAAVTDPTGAMFKIVA